MPFSYEAKNDNIHNNKEYMKSYRPLHFVIWACVATTTCSLALAVSLCLKSDRGTCASDGQQFTLVPPEGQACAGETVEVTIVGDGFGDIVVPVPPGGSGKAGSKPGGKCFFSGTYDCHGVSYQTPTGGFMFGRVPDGYSCANI